MDVEGEEKDRGKKRVRTKGIQKKLLEQVEFYFGDANLQRDKFLAKKIKEHPDGYVPVETIASFNRMKSLTSDISIVVQVMKTSTLLEVTDDGKWVRRSRPLTTATDTDERTIYVEHLPQSSDQDSVRKLLKVFGNITYISLPRHKISRKIKGFSFVEFATVQEANAAVEYFKAGAKPQTISASQKPNKCSADGKDSGKSKKQSEREEGKKGEEKSGGDGAGEKGREVEGEGEKGREDDGKMEMEGEVVEDRQGVKDVEKNEETEKAKEKEKEEEEESGNRKRKRGTGTPEIGEESAPDTKKSRSGKDAGGATDPQEEDKQTLPEKEHVREKTEEVRGIGEGTEATSLSTAPLTKEEDGACPEVSAQSRKRKRQDEGRGEERGEGDEEGRNKPGSKSTRIDPESPSNIGNRSNDIGDSGEVRMERLDSQTTTDTGGEEEEGPRTGGKKAKKRNRQHKKRDWEAVLKHLKLRVMSKREWLEMRKIFRDLQKEKIREMKEQLEEGEGEGKKRGKEYVGKCLVMVEGVGVGEGEDLVSIKKVEEICSKYGAVAYTDIKEGESEGYIRFAKSGCAENLVNDVSLAHVKFSAVSDADERAYYLKTMAARKQKQRWKKKRNIRGQDKIISRALQQPSHTKADPNKCASPAPAPTHIRFSDSDNES